MTSRNIENATKAIGKLAVEFGAQTKDRTFPMVLDLSDEGKVRLIYFESKKFKYKSF